MSIGKTITRLICVGGNVRDSLNCGREREDSGYRHENDREEKRWREGREGDKKV